MQPSASFSSNVPGLHVPRGEVFALKRQVLASGADSEAEAALRREVDILRRLPPHPNIIRCHGAEIVRSTAIRGATEALIVMDLCQRSLFEDIRDRHRMRRPFEENELAQLTFDTCRGLAALHTLEPPIAVSLRVSSAIMNRLVCLFVCL